MNTLEAFLWPFAVIALWLGINYVIDRAVRRWRQS